MTSPKKSTKQPMSPVQQWHTRHQSTLARAIHAHDVALVKAGQSPEEMPEQEARADTMYAVVHAAVFAALEGTQNAKNALPAMQRAIAAAAKYVRTHP
jgi:hypothetical protein